MGGYGLRDVWLQQRGGFDSCLHHRCGIAPRARFSGPRAASIDEPVERFVAPPLCVPPELLLGGREKKPLLRRKHGDETLDFLEHLSFTLVRPIDRTAGHPQERELGQAGARPRALLDIGMIQVQRRRMLRDRVAVVVERLAQDRLHRNLLHHHPVECREPLYRLCLVEKEHVGGGLVGGERLFKAIAAAGEVDGGRAGSRAVHKRRLGKPFHRAGPEAAAFDRVGARIGQRLDSFEHVFLERVELACRFVTEMVAHDHEVNALERGFQPALALAIADVLELRIDVGRKRLVDDEARPVVTVGAISGVQRRPRLVRQHVRALSAQ